MCTKLRTPTPSKIYDSIHCGMLPIANKKTTYQSDVHHTQQKHIPTQDFN
jgi:hypothetical protein